MDFHHGFTMARMSFHIKYNVASPGKSRALEREVEGSHVFKCTFLYANIAAGSQKTFNEKSPATATHDCREASM